MLAPPKPPPLVVDRPQDPEALIEEARKRSRRRRRRNSLAAGVILCMGTLGLAFHGWGPAGGGERQSKLSPRISVAARSTLMANGPLTVIRQARGRGGVYTINRDGLGRLVTRCDGCLEV